MQMTEKTWWFTVGAYLVFFLGFIFVERHGMQRAPMSSIDKVLVAPICWGFAFYGIQTGYVRGRFSRVERSESPFTFWLNIAFYSVVGFLFFWIGATGK
jgi:hypothetical protein